MINGSRKIGKAANFRNIKEKTNGMQWKAGSLQVLHPGSVMDPCIFQLFQNEVPIAVEGVTEMEALGVLLANDGNSQRCLHHRLSKATSGFHALSELFSTKVASLMTKF